MIYFIASADRSRIKIGVTDRLTVRLKALKARHGPGLHVLGVTDGSFKTEGKLHRRFSHLHTGDEWFQPGGDLLGFIGSETRPWDGSDEKTRHDPTLMEVKIDRDIVMKTRCVADTLGIKPTELLNRILSPIIDREFADAIPDEALRNRLRVEMAEALARHLDTIRRAHDQSEDSNLGQKTEEIRRAARPAK